MQDTKPSNPNTYYFHIYIYIYKEIQSISLFNQYHYSLVHMIYAIYKDLVHN